MEAKLKDDVEGTCTGRHGYIIRVIAINDIGEGILKPGSGLAEFQSRYTAIVMKPFKGEVVDAMVYNVNNHGFFAHVGPLSIFTSTHLLPVEYKFVADANPPEFASPDASLTPGSKVRLRIVGTRVDANEIFAIGTMKEDFLGPID